MTVHLPSLLIGLILLVVGLVADWIWKRRKTRRALAEAQREVENPFRDAGAAPMLSEYEPDPAVPVELPPEPEGPEVFDRSHRVGVWKKRQEQDRLRDASNVIHYHPRF